MKPAARQLVKDGQWLVSVEERPAGWESWPIRVIGVSGVPDVPRCGCGRPSREVGIGVWARWGDLRRSVELDFEGEPWKYLVSAKLLLAGLYTQDSRKAAYLCGEDARSCRHICERYRKAGVWTGNAVALGGVLEGGEEGMIELVLLALLGTGKVCQESPGQLAHLCAFISV